MPCLELRVDSAYHRIDSPNVEACGQWLVDVLTTYRIHPAMFLQLRVWPFLISDPKDPFGPGVPDWEANMQRWENVSAKSAAEAVQQFSERLARHAAEIRNDEENAHAPR